MAADDLTDFATCQLAFGCSDDAEDAIQRLITAASLWANKYTDRLLKARDLTEQYDGDNTTILFLRNYPINSITSIHQDSDRVFGVDTLVDPVNYVYSANSRKLTGVGVVWYFGVQTIQAILNAGYVGVPEDLENAVLELIDFWNQSFDAHRFGVNSVGVGDRRIAYELGIPKQVKEMLDSFRKKVVL